jgi:GDP-4-dehydro-6-deoxy-D-mannose reductase
MTKPVGTPFITGGGGFAGRYLDELLRSGGSEPVAPRRGDLDLLDAKAVRTAVAKAAPDVVFHLAAFASPRRSWDEPSTAVLDNLAITVNVLEAVRLEAPEAVLVLVTSGQVYGAAGDAPFGEKAPLAPESPYAVSKAACDMLGASYADGYGLRIVRVRPFNHAGPGQSDEYVLSSIARQVAEAEAASAAEAVLHTGDPTIARDFTDVRDVVRAYTLAVDARAGAYNVCSGRATTISDLIGLISEHARIPLRQVTDQALLRAHDPRCMSGSAERLAAAVGWKPEIPLSQTAADTLDWWRARVASGR